MFSSHPKVSLIFTENLVVFWDQLIYSYSVSLIEISALNYSTLISYSEGWGDLSDEYIRSGYLPSIQSIRRLDSAPEAVDYELGQNYNEEPQQAGICRYVWYGLLQLTTPKYLLPERAISAELFLRNALLIVIRGITSTNWLGIEFQCKTGLCQYIVYCV